MGTEEARRHLDVAKKQLERVQAAAYDPTDYEEAVNWAFYAYENAVVAAAEMTRVKWTKTHQSKASAASELFNRGSLSKDVSEKIVELNELRKDVQYGEPGEDLQELDLEDLAIDLEELINEVETLVESGNGH